MFLTCFSDETNDDQESLIEALMQAVSNLVDRLNQAEARVESDTEQKH